MNGVFQSTPSGGKATRRSPVSRRRRRVSIHAFRGEGDQASPVRRQPPDRVSIHAFRGEGDRSRANYRSVRCGFNPRLPGGRRPETRLGRVCSTRVSIHAFRGEGDGLIKLMLGISADVSIHAFRGEGDSSDIRIRRVWAVSIHAFRGEGDRSGLFAPLPDALVSIHAFRGEGDRSPRCHNTSYK